MGWFDGVNDLIHHGEHEIKKIGSNIEHSVSRTLKDLANQAAQTISDAAESIPAPLREAAAHAGSSFDDLLNGNLSQACHDLQRSVHDIDNVIGELFGNEHILKFDTDKVNEVLHHLEQVIASSGWNNLPNASIQDGLLPRSVHALRDVLSNFAQVEKKLHGDAHAISIKVHDSMDAVLHHDERSAMKMLSRKK